ncbi:hypothetical protein E4U54_004705, partial [Claviceps lovelessii]
MATALPRPSRSSNGPPNMALPALPMHKMRASTGNIPGSAFDLTPAKSGPSTPRSGLRAPSSMLGPPTPAPNTALPQHKGFQPTNAAGKTLRKTVSISSFPHPPRGDNRCSSLPPSPLSGEKTRSRRSRTSKDLSNPTTYSPSTPSLLNGSGEGKSITNSRMSDGFISISSPPQSRSSSAQGSYSTSATTCDDPIEGSGSKHDSGIGVSSFSSDKRASKSEGRGNVLVSVRVRPDNNNNNNHNDNTGQSSPEGEWMVDGRKSLIAYRGKEAGDYIY